MSSTLFLASGRPLPEVSYPENAAVSLDLDRGVFDGSFAIFPTKKPLEVPSEKAYFMVLEWQYTSERAQNLIEYLEKNLETAGEIEIWHVWQDMDFGHKVRKARIPIGGLTAEDLQELDRLEVWREPVTDYCYVIS